jgi:hypothetical protein
MNPSSLNPNNYFYFSERRRVQGEVPLEVAPSQMAPKALTEANTVAHKLIMEGDVETSGHIYSYMSERNFSEIELQQMLLSGNITLALGVDVNGLVRYQMRAKNAKGVKYRIILSVTDKVNIISVFERPLEN